MINMLVSDYLKVSERYLIHPGRIEVVKRIGITPQQDPIRELNKHLNELLPPLIEPSLIELSPSNRTFSNRTNPRVQLEERIR